MVSVRVTLNQANITKLVTEPRSPVVRYSHRLGAATTATAKLLVGVDTGRLRQAIGYTVTPVPPHVSRVRVTAATNYALVHHEGHKPIKPRRAKVLAWRNKQGDRVFAYRVRAVAGNKFLVKAVMAVTGKPVRRRRARR